jgi:hypothetical protein
VSKALGVEIKLAMVLLLHVEHQLSLPMGIDKEINHRILARRGAEVEIHEELVDIHIV